MRDGSGSITFIIEQSEDKKAITATVFQGIHVNRKISPKGWGPTVAAAISNAAMEMGDNPGVFMEDADITVGKLSLGVRSPSS